MSAGQYPSIREGRKGTPPLVFGDSLRDAILNGVPTRGSFRFFVNRMLVTPTTILLKLDLFSDQFLIFSAPVINSFAGTARKFD